MTKLGAGAHLSCRYQGWKDPEVVPCSSPTDHSGTGAGGMRKWRVGAHLGSRYRRDGRNHRLGAMLVLWVPLTYA